MATKAYGIWEVGGGFNYIFYFLKKKHCINIFLEMGRSKSGKLAFYEFPPVNPFHLP